MKINIVHLGLPDFFLRKSDIIYGLYHALQSLGYDTTITHNQLNGKSMNLIIGSDIVSSDPSAIQQLIRADFDYAVFEVENFNGSTINYIPDFPLNNYLMLLENAKFIITPYQYNLRSLVSVCGQEKVRYAKWGYHESMKTGNVSRTNKFEFDALFFGLIKGTRQQKYETLKQNLSSKIKVITAKDPYTLRDYAVSQSRFGLSLSYGETDDFVNPFRLFYMAANGMPILADNVKDSDDYLNICEKVSHDTLVDFILDQDKNSTNSFERCLEQKLAANLKEVL